MLERRRLPTKRESLNTRSALYWSNGYTNGSRQPAWSSRKANHELTRMAETCSPAVSHNTRCHVERNISRVISVLGRYGIDMRCKAWPCGLLPRRCSFASLRVTMRDLQVRHVRLS